MPWPALLDDPGPSHSGTLYVSRGRVGQYFERHHYTGQAWKLRNEYTTYCPNKARTYKTTARLKFDSAEQFWIVMRTAEALGLSPPISYSDLFFQQCRVKHLPRYTWLAPFRRFIFGGWEQAFHEGEYRGPVWYYDLNSAYRWAGSCGLPDVRQLERTHSFSDPVGVYLVELARDTLPYASRAGLHMLTSEERDAFNVQPIRMLHGVKCGALSDELASAWPRIEGKWPLEIVKRMGRAYWGKFNTRIGPKQCSWKSGASERKMQNHFFNPIWSAFITSRVKMRLAVFKSVALHVYVDSILTKAEIPCGGEIGEFRCLDGRNDGVYIRGATRWKWGPNAPGRWPVGTYLGGE